LTGKLGARPISTVDDRLWMSFSGEIYNHLELRDELISGPHRFATRSGTEVILNAYREHGDERSNHLGA
jgi:asparagine synthase (glutamine-hydrolysing)